MLNSANSAGHDSDKESRRSEMDHLVRDSTYEARAIGAIGIEAAETSEFTTPPETCKSQHVHHLEEIKDDALPHSDV